MKSAQRMQYSEPYDVGYEEHNIESIILPDGKSIEVGKANVTAIIAYRDGKSNDLWFCIYRDSDKHYTTKVNIYGFEINYEHKRESAKRAADKLKEAAENIIKNQKTIDETESDEEAIDKHLNQYAPGGGTWSKSGWMAQKGTP